MRQETAKVEGLDLRRRLSDVPVEGLPPIKADCVRPRETTGHLVARTSQLAVPARGNNHPPNRGVIGTFDRAIAHRKIAESAKRLDHLMV